MVQSTGTKKIKCAVFISGTGSNLKTLIQLSKNKKTLPGHFRFAGSLIKIPTRLESFFKF